MVDILINGQPHRVEVAKDKPLLWTLREDLGYHGTKFGCGYGACGACTVHVDGRAVRSCIFETGAASSRQITTIEGLEDRIGSALKKAWRDIEVPQCGYCQPGMIMACAAALQEKKDQGLEAVLQQVSNLCRCGTYNEIRAAVASALETLAEEDS